MNDQIETPNFPASGEVLSCAFPTDRQWWAMCDCHMSRPVPLTRAAITRPFVYCREYGLFYVVRAYHQAAMSLLLAWQHGLDRGVDVAEKLGLEYSHGTADRWLELTPGAAFMSSVGEGKIEVGREGNLNRHELRVFGEVLRLF